MATKFNQWLFVLTLLAPNVYASDCVILLHGLARSASSMVPIEKHLTDLRYHVVNVDYPSTTNTIETLSAQTIKPAIARCPTTGTIHVVSHSMGGILLRQHLAHNTMVRLGRVVMLGPPNQGSEVVDKLKNIPGFAWYNGPAGMQLGTAQTDFLSTLPTVKFQLGVIAGNSSINPLLSWLIPANDDGKVSVERTKITGMVDHLVLPVSHTFMMRNKSVIKQVAHFLNNGSFSKP